MHGKSVEPVEASGLDVASPLTSNNGQKIHQQIFQVGQKFKIKIHKITQISCVVFTLSFFVKKVLYYIHNISRKNTKNKKNKRESSRITISLKISKFADHG